MSCIEDKIKIVGISRGDEFSPNHVGNDAAIFRLTVEELEKSGFIVEVYTEKLFLESRIKPDFVFDMARDRATVNRLKGLEDEGAVVVNSGYGIDNCVRKTMTEILIKNKIPHPESFIIPTDTNFSPEIFPCWIKRGDSHAMVKEDVVYVESRQEAEIVLKDFKKRGIPEAVVNKHLVGDLIKFYGIAGTDFFYTFYPTEQSHSKFGLEAINGENRGYPFDIEKLKEYSNRAAEALNVPIYGGDCVVSSEGDIKIIDFNDWPSFARCRDEAAPFIAECIKRRILKNISGNE